MTDERQRPCTPHDDMTDLDEKGAPYWIEVRDLRGDTGSDLPFDVLRHGPKWVLIQPGGGESRIWVRWADLGPFAIVEGCAQSCA